MTTKLAAAVLTKYSHHFTVTQITTYQVRHVVEQFYASFAQWSLGKRPDGTSGRFISRYFAFRTKDQTQYRFHINAWNQFCADLQAKGIARDHVVIEIAPIFEAMPAKLVFNTPHTPNENQNRIHEYLMAASPVSKLVTEQTGKGKTLMSGRRMCAKGERILVVIRPMYTKKWIKDIMELCSVPRKRIVVINGGKALRNLLQFEPEELPYDAIIISNKTLKGWFTEYEQYGDAILSQGYDVTPVEMCARLGCGEYYVDERHQDFHLNFLLDLFTHNNGTISTTATYMSDDKFISRMQGILHPRSTRAVESEYNVYARITSFHYWFNEPGRIKLTQYGNNSYSHSAFEDSILRNPKTTYNYFCMIRDIVKMYWEAANQKPGDRCLVFFFTKEMCRKFVDFIRPTYPGKIINHYVEGDPYANLIESDLTASTVLSAGTAHDVQQLTVAIMTIALKQSSTNMQVLGRLRDLRDGRNPWFVYLVCEDFAKHQEYHLAKQQLFMQKKLPLFSRAYGDKV